MKLLILFAGLFVLTVGYKAYAIEPTFDGPPATTQALTSWFDKNVPASYKTNVPLIVHEMNRSDLMDYINKDDGANSRKKVSVKDEGDIDGVYDSKPPRLAIAIEDNGLVDTFIFAHEYGHYIWFDVMSKDDRKAYERIYKQSKSDGHLVTDYSYANVEEGFAEAFSFYVNLPADLQRRDAGSYAFLANWTIPANATSAPLQ